MATNRSDSETSDISSSSSRCAMLIGAVLRSSSAWPLLDQKFDHSREPMRVAGRAEQRVFRLVLVRHAGVLRMVVVRDVLGPALGDSAQSHHLAQQCEVHLVSDGESARARTATAEPYLAGGRVKIRRVSFFAARPWHQNRNSTLRTIA